MKITVNAYKWDGSLKYHWPGEIIGQSEAEIVVAGAFRREYQTPYCHFLPGDTTIEFYPRDSWYNICQIYRNSDELLGIYCNLATPPARRGNLLTYIDLELDLFVYPDGRSVVLDAAEFERLAATNLPVDAAEAARESWAELLEQVEARQGVFAIIGGQASNLPE